MRRVLCILLGLAVFAPVMANCSFKTPRLSVSEFRSKCRLANAEGCSTVGNRRMCSEMGRRLQADFSGLDDCLSTCSLGSIADLMGPQGHMCMREAREVQDWCNRYCRTNYAQ